jgi:hypothetical protein
MATTIEVQVSGETPGGVRNRFPVLLRPHEFLSRHVDPDAPTT